MPHYQHRTYKPLPPAESLPFPGGLVRVCTDCHLCDTRTNAVPGEGPTPAEVMLVGEAPGYNEDKEGRPFVGAAGQYLDSLLFQCGIQRDAAYITNVVKCRPPNNRTPATAEVKACSKWRSIELGVVQPHIIVAMGATAIRYFLGSDAGTVEHLHGKPVEKDGCIILPCYHPAAALHDTTHLRQVAEDFNVLRGLAKGTPLSAYHVHDEFPNPVYQVADTPAKLKQMRDEINDVGEFAVDTEACRGRLWSAQFSAVPGTAWFLPIKDDFKGRLDLRGYNATADIHNYLYDIRDIIVDDDRFVDSMVMAYLCGQPQGLKTLANRLCGINMQTYSETISKGQQELTLDYLTKVALRKWPDPELTDDTKWDNKKGCLVTKAKKPWNIGRKVTNIFKDLSGDSETNPFERWKSIPANERQVVESVLGIMPESSLMDIKYEDAIEYACRDAMATLRVKHKLDKMIDDLDLRYILDIDLKILPMVYNMMQNGMAVDVEHFKNLSADYDVRMRAVAAKLAGMVGHPFNPASSDQVALVVYKELGFKPTANTTSGKISTDDAELKKVKHPVVKDILEYRGLVKLKSTYADNMVRSAHPDEHGVNRMHTVLTTTRVETGRLSSKKDDSGEGANLQNIPTRNKEAKEIKNGFIASPGTKLCEIDYSQIEMRTLAHLSQCKRLIDMFLRDGDPHTEMAAELFHIITEQAKQEKYRYPIKRLNFGVAYLIGAQGLSNQITEYVSDLEMAGEKVEIEPWDVETCEKFLDHWYKLNPEVKDFQLERVAEARRTGRVVDIVGRTRFIPEVNCPIKNIQEAGARQAANFPVTSSAQAIIKLAMGRLWRELPKTEWANHVRWEMQIHDSIVVEITDDNKIIKPCLKWMLDIMTGVVKLRVPVKADAKVGYRWAEMEKIKLENSK